MEIIGGILLLGLLAGISLLVGHLRKQATRALNRNLFKRDKHNRGRATIQEEISFSAPVSAATVQATARDRLNLPHEMPAAFVAALHVIADQPGALVFGYGNKLSQTFRSALLIEDLPGGGSRATYRVLNWVEGDGIVRGIAEMELLANTVRSVAAELGASYGAVPTGMPPVPNAPTPPTRTQDAAGSVPLAIQVAPATCAICGSPELGERFCTDCGTAIA